MGIEAVFVAFVQSFVRVEVHRKIICHSKGALVQYVCATVNLILSFVDLLFSGIHIWLSLSNSHILVQEPLGSPVSVLPPHFRAR